VEWRVYDGHHSGTNPHRMISSADGLTKLLILVEECM